MAQKRAKIIALANNKGGVGKTTTAAAIGANLARRGNDVLFVDADAQANLTLSFGIETLGIVYEIMRTPNRDTSGCEPESIKLTTSGAKVGKCDILTGNRQLVGIETGIASAQDKFTRLAAHLEYYRTKYDFIIIDTPPAICALTLNALFAADFVLIPTEPHTLATAGLANLRQVIEEVAQRKGKPTQYAVLLTAYSNRKGLHKLTADTIAKAGFNVFNTKIRECIAIGEAQSICADLYEYAPKSNAAADYDAATGELVKALKKL